MFQKCESAKKLVLVISILIFASILLLIFNCNTNLVLPRLLNEQIWDVIANSKEVEINARHENDHQLPDENEIKVGSDDRFEANFEARWEEVQLQRRLMVDKACAQRRDSGEIYHQGMFTYNKKYKLLYCLQPKVSSTTWLRHFVSLEKRRIQEIFNTGGRYVQKHLLEPTSPDIANLAKTSISFSMVRHPFERLVSAYRNKVKDSHPNNQFHREIRGLIAQHGDISFSSFVKWLLSKDHSDLCRKEQKLVRCPLNNHWSPLQNRCAYCSMPYKIIAKYETFEKDLRYIEQLANVTFDKHLHENPSMVNEVEKTKINDTGKSFGKTKAEKLDNVTTQEGLAFFKQLTVTEVEALYRFYKEDFVMFGYSPQLYLEAASSN